MSEKKDRKDALAVPPENFEKARIKPQEESAAGIKGITTAIKHVKNEVGASAMVNLLPKVNQFDGFDCPGCAWPDPDEKRSFLAEYCENGAKAVAEEATTKKADANFWARHSVFELSNFSDYELGKSGRITEPLLLDKDDDHYRPISWGKAFELIAEELNGLQSPDEAIFYTSGRASNEAAFIYQLFIRNFGTNNLPDCSNMCHESSGVALSETVGLGKGSVKLEDFEQSEVIVIMGQNPGTNHPRMLSSLERARKNGAQIIAVNPLREPGLLSFKNPQGISLLKKERISTDYLSLKIGTDAALLKAWMKLLIKWSESKPEILDKEFINSKTQDFDELVKDLENYSLDQLIEDTGLSKDEVIRTAKVLAEKKRIIMCWAMGLTQHRNSVGAIQDIINVLLMKGSIGIKGGGTCPVRGHSNVQGDRSMGIYEKPASDFLDKMEEEFDCKLPREHGYDVAEAIEAMEAKKAGVFVALGGNFLSASPDTNFCARALQNCSLTVQISTKPNRSHLIHGERALILPCLGRSEEDITKAGSQILSVENSMGVVHSTAGDREPASKHLKSEVQIVAGLASATLGTKAVVDYSQWAENYDLVREAVSRVIPGFENYNERVRKPGGFYLPNGPRERDFSAVGGYARFSVNKWEAAGPGEGRYIMMTIRSHDQFNTTIYGLNDRYRGVYNERRVIFMNENDMKADGLAKGHVVNISSHFKQKERKAYRFIVIPFDIPTGCVATYFPEANVLVPIDSRAEKSNTPTSKSVVVSLEKVGETVAV